MPEATPRWLTGYACGFCILVGLLAQNQYGANVKVSGVPRGDLEAVRDLP